VALDAAVTTLGMTILASTAKILLVDDHPANLKALEATLEPLAQPLVRANSGAEALELLQAGDFALALLDVHMPGLDGYDTCRAMRAAAHTRSVPVIFMTAVYNDRQHEATGYASGAVDYICKPFDPLVLRAKVGAFVGMYLQSREIERQATALREAERVAIVEAAARRDAEAANDAKDHFLAILSHELRTPLNTILGWAKMLRSGQLDAERSTKALDTLIRCGHAQNRLIEDLLDSARIVAGKLQLRKSATELASLIESSIEEQQLLAQQRRVRVEVEGTPERCIIDADPYRLRQVVGNLLSNAVKFSTAGGRVVVRLQALDGVARIEVEDDGVGIPPAFLPHVFDRFRQAHDDDTRQHGGLGLGLAIVKHLVELHGGTITVSSGGPGLGARFAIELPLDSVDGGAQALRRTSTGRFRALRAESTDLTGVRVLFVDDEEDTRELVGQMLSDAGAHVSLAASVAEAMTLLHLQAIDVIVSDLSMPQEDGFSFARRVAARLSETGVSIPTIALSAYASVEDRERALEAGFETHIAKPFEPARLLSLIAALALKR
jgi:signal transduction histidine kinase